jgi:chaperone modulatory protein CbpM
MKSIQTENLIAVDAFCLNNNVETSFIGLLQQSGLIDISVIQETKFIDAGQLLQLEKMVRFYYEWDINIEGIETITHLLQQINVLQDELTMLKNRLRFYE